MLNAGFLLSKTEELADLALQKNLDIICVTETWLHDGIRDDEICLPGYTAYLRLQPEQRRFRRILRAERLSFEWKLANSAKTAPKRLPARILQLRHPRGSLINSDQERLKTTFLGFFRDDEGSTPVRQPRTQTYMADPPITKLEVRRALDGPKLHKGAGPDGLFPTVLKALISHIARTFNRSIKTPQVPDF